MDLLVLEDYLNKLYNPKIDKQTKYILGIN